mmetsp:Transcript_5062/g.18375  ORF Transcript_5062/g.18375 Transcript_5062/m.18375 type:complete len:213 (+) Transcript_5062:265-903(+)
MTSASALPNCRTITFDPISGDQNAARSLVAPGTASPEASMTHPSGNDARATSSSSSRVSHAAMSSLASSSLILTAFSISTLIICCLKSRCADCVFTSSKSARASLKYVAASARRLVCTSLSRPRALAKIARFSRAASPLASASISASAFANASRASAIKSLDNPKPAAMCNALLSPVSPQSNRYVGCKVRKLNSTAATCATADASVAVLTSS